MRSVGRRALLPSVVMVCLPILQLEASAAETVRVSDGAGTWEMTISPQDGTIVPEQPTPEAAPIILAAFQEDTEAEAAVPEPVEAEESLAPESVPAEQVDPAVPAEDAGEPIPVVTPAPGVDPAAYWCVYRTIPFIRTEYLANPSYRHEATMEFLFGQLRPTVIHKHQEVAPPVAPVVAPAPAPPWVYDIYLGQIPTFIQRYQPPMIPLGGYPLSY